MAVEGVDQPGQFGQGVAHLATGAGANPQAVIDVHQRPPAVPLAPPTTSASGSRRAGPLWPAWAGGAGAARTEVLTARHGLTSGVRHTSHRSGQPDPSHVPGCGGTSRLSCRVVGAEGAEVDVSRARVVTATDRDRDAGIAAARRTPPSRDPDNRHRGRPR